MVERGRIVVVEYSLFVKDTGELVDTTSEVEAKLYRKYSEGVVYEPEIVVVGEGRFFPGFDESLASCEVGKEVEFEVPPEKAYGPRDSSKVRVFPRRLFERQNVKPEVGKEVTVNNEVGRIITVDGGRVVVDFNHPLAGKTLKLKVKVLKVVEDTAEAVKYLVKRRLRGAKVEGIFVAVDQESGRVTVELPKEFRVGRDVQYAKALAAYDVLRYVKGVKEVVFVDRFTSDELRG